MRFTFDSRRKKSATLERLHPGATFVDVTSRARRPFVELSPFYPHGSIPVPFFDGLFSQSVEGIWQGLKVFENAGTDLSKLNVSQMKGIKRSVRTNGRVRGHAAGGQTLLSYLDARWLIYLPSYHHVLVGPGAGALDALRALPSRRIVLLDYETNGDINDLSRPLSHAALVAQFLNASWPSRQPAHDCTNA